MDIKLIEGQGARIYLSITDGETGVVPPTLEVYGAIEAAQLTVTPDATGAAVWTVEIPAMQRDGSSVRRYQVMVRRPTSGLEWLALSGAVVLRPRIAAQSADVLSYPAYQASFDLEANRLTSEGEVPDTDDPGNGVYVTDNYIFFTDSSWTSAKVKFSGTKINGSNSPYFSLVEKYVTERLDIELPDQVSSSNVLLCRNTRVISAKLPKMTSFYNLMGSSTKLQVVYVDFSNAIQSPKVFIAVFEGCQLFKESVLRTLATIPITRLNGGIITYGIHIDYKDDPDIMAAFQAFVDYSDNWKPVIQWNGTPGASDKYANNSEARMAAPLSVESLPVWVQLVSDDEHPTHLTADGQRVHLRWAHELFGKTDGWSQYDSLGAAVAALNLTQLDA